MRCSSSVIFQLIFFSSCIVKLPRICWIYNYYHSLFCNDRFPFDFILSWLHEKEKRAYKCNYTRTKRIYVRAILPVFETDSSSSFGFIVGQILSLTSSFASFKIHWRKLLTDCPLHDGFSAKQDKTSCRKRKYTRFYFLENIFCPLPRIFQTFVLTKRQWKPSGSFE